jgi:hypothetical protein
VQGKRVVNLSQIRRSGARGRRVIRTLPIRALSGRIRVNRRRRGTDGAAQRVAVHLAVVCGVPYLRVAVTFLILSAALIESRIGPASAAVVIEIAALAERIILSQRKCLAITTAAARLPLVRECTSRASTAASVTSASPRRTSRHSTGRGDRALARRVQLRAPSQLAPLRDSEGLRRPRSLQGAAFGGGCRRPCRRDRYAWSSRHLPDRRRTD